MSYFELMGFGPKGWGWPLLMAAGMTLAVALCGFLAGAVLGTLVAWAKLSRSLIARSLGDGYTTVLRGIPDLLVIYLFYFGGSAALSAVGQPVRRRTGFIGVPAFATGALAIGIVSGAYQAEVFRGAYQASTAARLEAATSVGMHRMLMFRRIIAPQVLRYAIPGLGNVWQLVLKESALISVTGLVELLRQSQIGAGSTRQPFDFYFTAAMLYLVITRVSTWCSRRPRTHSMRGLQEGSLMDLAFMGETFVKLLERRAADPEARLHARSRSAPIAGAASSPHAHVAASRCSTGSRAAYVFVFRGTPLLVQIFLIYYGLGQFRPALQELGVCGRSSASPIGARSWR